VSRTPRVQLHPLAATWSGFPANSPSTVLAMVSLPVRSIAMDIHVFQTVRKYGQSPITTYRPSSWNQKLLENVQVLTLKPHACLMQFKLHRYVRLVSLKLCKPLNHSCATTLWASENKMGYTSSRRHPLLITVASHQYHSLGNYYSITHCITKREWPSVMR
jgi:hypothetical protein